jgi:hypothetical protein
MITTIVVEGKINAKPFFSILNYLITFYINLFILDTSPETLCEDVIKNPPLSIHADSDLLVQ